MDCEILLCRSTIAKLMAWEDDPKSNYGTRTNPAMDSTILVIHGILVLVINLLSFTCEKIKNPG